MSELTYEQHNNKSLAVRGNKQKYETVIKNMGGRWNSRLKGGPGWTLPIEKEPDLKKFIQDMSETHYEEDEEEDEPDLNSDLPVVDSEDDIETKIQKISEHVRSRKEQHKYHRAVSVTPPERSPQLTTQAPIKARQLSESPQKSPVAKSPVPKSSAREIEPPVRSSNPVRSSSPQKPKVDKKKHRKHKNRRDSSSDSSSEEEEVVKRRESRHHHKKKKHVSSSESSESEEEDVGRKRRSHRDEKYYKSYAKKRREPSSSESSESSDDVVSSESEDSSSDDFPEPETPRVSKRKSRNEHEDLYTRIKNMRLQEANSKKSHHSHHPHQSHKDRRHKK